jgi:sn-glycerol 3-phosphate transport system permease protein
MSADLALDVSDRRDERLDETALIARHQHRRRRVRRVATYLLLTLAAVIVVFPVYMTFVGSLLPISDLARQPPPFFPTHPLWSNYKIAWQDNDLGVYLRNSAVQTAIIVVGQLTTSILAAYAFAFLRFPLKRTLFVVFLATLMVPFEVTLATNLSTIESLGWFNTFQGLTIPFLAWAFGIFMLRQAFLQIPRDLQEAATLDGFGHWRFMTRVAIPLARPTIAALAVFSFLAAWNQYLWPLVITGDNNNIRTVQIGLKLLAGNNVAGHINIVQAGAIIAAIPLLIVLILFQKQLIRSITAGAVK